MELKLRETSFVDTEVTVRCACMSLRQRQKPNVRCHHSRPPLYHESGRRMQCWFEMIYFYKKDSAPERAVQQTEKHLFNTRDKQTQ